MRRAEARRSDRLCRRIEARLAEQRRVCAAIAPALRLERSSGCRGGGCSGRAAHRGGRIARRRARGRRIARHGARDCHRMGGQGHASDRLALNRLALYRLAEGGGVPVGGEGTVSVVGPSGLARVGARVRARIRVRARGGEG